METVAIAILALLVIAGILGGFLWRPNKGEVEENSTIPKEPVEQEKEPPVREELYQKQVLKRLKSIDNNFKFFFWLTIVGLVILLIAEWINLLNPDG